MKLLLVCLAAICALAAGQGEGNGAPELKLGNPEKCVKKIIQCSNQFKGAARNSQGFKNCLGKCKDSKLVIDKFYDTVEETVKLGGGSTMSPEDLQELVEELEQDLGAINEEEYAVYDSLVDALNDTLTSNPNDHVKGLGASRSYGDLAIALRTLYLRSECNRAMARLYGLEWEDDDSLSPPDYYPDKDGADAADYEECILGAQEDGDAGARRKRSADMVAGRKWGSNTLNYVFCRSAENDPTLRDNVRAAAQFLSAHSCVNLVEGPADDMVVISTHKPGCLAHRGRQGGSQLLNLAHTACHKYHTVAHHFLIALGIYHEIQRSDRDSYVSINWANIQQDKLAAFQMCSDCSHYDVAYEYMSVMHPISTAYSSNGQATVTAVGNADMSETMGSAYGGPTFLDLLLLNSHYCPGACPGKSCANGGFPNPANCNECICPDAYCGSSCEQLCTGGPHSCGGELVASGDWQCISSPNYPDNHPRGQDCTWHITAPADHQRIVWKFTGDKFAFAYTAAPVCINYVLVRTGQSMASGGQAFCGYSVPSQQLTSDFDQMMVLMRNPDADKNYNGFQGCYKIADVTSYPPTPIDCEVGDWTQWSQCSVSCSGGYRQRTRDVVAPCLYGGVTCEEVGTSEQEACAQDPCPIPCISSGYNNWSPCMDGSGAVLECGSGSRSRSLIILQEAAHGGPDCPEARSESESCECGPCEVDCEYYPIDSEYAWEAFSDCTTTCGEGTKTARRMIMIEAKNGGKECHELEDEQHTLTVPCDENDPCPVDCSCGNWVLGECSVTCGEGVQVDTRPVLQNPMYGGEECPETTRTSPCELDPCPIDCECGPKEPKTECSVTCGGGVQTFAHDILVQPQYGGLSCEEVLGEPVSEDLVCNDKPCPIDCVLGGWRAIGNCSCECGVGTQSYERIILVEPMYGGVECEDIGDMTKEDSCQMYCDDHEHCLDQPGGGICVCDEHYFRRPDGDCHYIECVCPTPSPFPYVRRK